MLLILLNGAVLRLRLNKCNVHNFETLINVWEDCCDFAMSFNYSNTNIFVNTKNSFSESFMK
jgi:hypothetical protein